MEAWKVTAENLERLSNVEMKDIAKVRRMKAVTYKNRDGMLVRAPKTEIKFSEADRKLIASTVRYIARKAMV